MYLSFILLFCISWYLIQIAGPFRIVKPLVLGESTTMFSMVIAAFARSPSMEISGWVINFMLLHENFSVFFNSRLYTGFMDFVRSHLKWPDTNYFPSPPFPLIVLFCFISGFVTTYVSVWYSMWLLSAADWCLGIWGHSTHEGHCTDWCSQSTKDRISGWDSSAFPGYSWDRFVVFFLFWDVQHFSPNQMRFL